MIRIRRVFNLRVSPFLPLNLIQNVYFIEFLFPHRTFYTLLFLVELDRLVKNRHYNFQRKNYLIQKNIYNIYIYIKQEKGKTEKGEKENNNRLNEIQSIET